MKNDILNELYKPFGEIKQKPGSGQYKYVASRDVIDRMNKVFEGNWSSEIMESEIVEDNVLVCVRVYVKDNGNTFYHEGYGSSQIARFTFGDKKGKTINIGNNYNSAKSLAIKDACKKWGVALYIEDTPDEEDAPPTTFPDNLGAVPVGTGVMTEETGLKEFKRELKKEDNKEEEKVGEFTPPPFPDGPQIYKSTQPMIDTVQTFPSTVEKELTPPSFPIIVEDTDHTPPHGNITPVESSVGITQETTVDKITDVQKVAVQGLLQLKGLNREKLFADALGRTDNLPASSDVLTYQEAVLVIKYGNDVDRK